MPARRYVVVWQRCERACKTETLRSLRNSMLSWSRGAMAGTSKPAPAPRPVPILVRQFDLCSSAEEGFSDGETEGTLLAGAAALARRRHAIKFKRKSKIAFRVLRFVHYRIYQCARTYELIRNMCIYCSCTHTYLKGRCKYECTNSLVRAYFKKNPIPTCVVVNYD